MSQPTTPRKQKFESGGYYVSPLSGLAFQAPRHVIYLSSDDEDDFVRVQTGEGNILGGVATDVH